MLRIITSRNYNCEKVEGKGEGRGIWDLRTKREGRGKGERKQEVITDRF